MIGQSRKNKGFTLLELLVVLVIIGLVASMVSPKLAGSLSGLNTKTAAQKIAAALRYTRSKAASEKSMYRAQFDTEARTFVIEKIEGFSNRIQLSDISDTDLPTLYSYELPEGIFFKTDVGLSKEPDRNIFSVGFYPSGGSSGGGIIVEDVRGKGYRIQVDFITGSVRLMEA